jgi:hypothetical protein
MRKILIFTVIALLYTFGLRSANAEVFNVNQTFTTDTVFNPFTPPPEDVIYTIKISGSVTMNSLTSLIRVILFTDEGEFMVLEAFPLIAADTAWEFSGYCDETCYLDGLTPFEIRLEIINASIYIEDFFYDLEEVEDASAKQYIEKKNSDHIKVDMINFNIA